MGQREGKGQSGRKEQKELKGTGDRGQVRSALLDWVKQDEFLLPLGGSRPQHV